MVREFKSGDNVTFHHILFFFSPESVIYLGHSNYIFSENAGTVEIEVYRHGSDLSYTSMVWCAPKDTLPQSASPGQDYVPNANRLTFDPQQTVEVRSR